MLIEASYVRVCARVCLRNYIRVWEIFVFLKLFVLFAAFNQDHINCNEISIPVNINIHDTYIYIHDT